MNTGLARAARWGWVAVAVVGSAGPGCIVDPPLELEPPGADLPEVCEAERPAFYPELGETSVYYRTEIVLTYADSESIGDGLVEVTAASGARVEGVTQWSDDGLTVTFTPATPLAPSMGYTVTVDGGCAGAWSVTWATSAAGSAADASVLAGGVYDLDLATGRWSGAEGGANVLLGLAGDRPALLVTAVGAADGGVTLRAAWASALDAAREVDVCLPTSDLALEVDLTASPYFEITEPEVWLNLGGTPVRFEAVRVTGAWSPDGAALEGVTVDARLDLRGQTELGAQACEVAGDLFNCVACADGEVACVEIGVDRLTLPRLSIEGLAEIRPEDVSANPVCGAM